MVRKELLTVSLMADGYPIDGKPKDKAEKMHPEIWKRWIALIAIVAIVAVVAYFAFAVQTPAKTSQDASQEVKTAEVQPAENAVVNIAAIDWQKKLETDMQNPDKKWSIERLTGDNKALVPIGTKEIALTNSILLTEISVDRKNWVVSGYIENKGATTPIFAVGIKFFPVSKDYNALGNMYIVILNGVNLNTLTSDELERVKPGQKLYFETTLMEFDPKASQKYLELLSTAPYLAVEYKI